MPKYFDQAYGWYNPKPKRKSEGQQKHCPVCKTYLGLQEPSMEVSLHCDDCKAWYTWFPEVDLPTAKLDSHMPKICNCAGCKQRRGEMD